MKEQKEIKFIKEFKWMLTLLEDYKDSSLIEINGESGRGGGKNVLMILSFALWMAKNDLSFNLAVFRKQSKDIVDIWGDFENYLPYEWKIKHKYKKTYINGNLATFNSLFTSSDKPQSNLGKSMNPGADYMIVWMDETTQITNEDRSKIKQAYGRFGKKIVVVNTWNPWSPYNEMVQYMAEHMPYPGVEYMKEHHYQQEVVQTVSESRGKQLKTTKIFFRTSAYINPFSSDAHIMALEDIAAQNEDEGNTILWAKPGVVDGAVYRNLEKCIVDNKWYEENQVHITKIVAGIDFGVMDATSVSLIGVASDNFSRDHSIHILDEYYHQNRKGEERKDIKDYAVEVLKYLVEKFNEYQIGSSNSTVLNCYVDYAKQRASDNTFVEVLTQLAREQGIFNIQFHKAKKVEIRDRIVLVNHLVAWDRFYINEERASNHAREFRDAHYDVSRINKDGFHPRADGSDHAINAAEYGIEAVRSGLHTMDYLKL